MTMAASFVKIIDIVVDMLMWLIISSFARYNSLSS